MINIITVEEVEHIAFRLAKEELTFDEPIPEFRTRYPNRLESCLSTPFQTFGKKDLYPTFFNKAAILFYLMNKNHPFANGNKRVAMSTLLYFLGEHNKWLEVNTQVLYNFAIWVAGSPPDAKQEVLKYIEKFLKNHIVPWKK